MEKIDIPQNLTVAELLRTDGFNIRNELNNYIVRVIQEYADKNGMSFKMASERARIDLEKRTVTF